ncbi:MAG: sugar kinase [Chitinophagaceae bacterium]|nr:sugar kinase [Chitinophagaceae bacterium]
MDNETVIGIDMGGTSVRAGLVSNNKLSSLLSQKITSKGSVEEVLEDLFTLADKLITTSIKAIGIGVPGLVDADEGIVFDLINIPSWKSVPLQQRMEERYKVPVLINNDANCFALGEYYFGKGKDYQSMIGLTIGTGLGSGIVLNKKLYSGKNCGAGEFGIADYLDKYCEYYASGQFFKNVYGIDGETVFANAKKGDAAAIKMYEEMGAHLGNAIKLIMGAYDPEIIILGGSVRHAWKYFNKTMWQRIKTFPYKKVADNLQIEISELENSGILGAAALYYNNAMSI